MLLIETLWLIGRQSLGVEEWKQKYLLGVRREDLLIFGTGQYALIG
jgi:hypothetical protein